MATEIVFGDEKVKTLPKVPKHIGGDALSFLLGAIDSAGAGLPSLHKPYKELRQIGSQVNPVAHGLGVGAGFIPGLATKGLLKLLGLGVGKAGLKGAGQTLSTLGTKSEKALQKAPIEILTKIGRKAGSKAGKLKTPANIATQAGIYGGVVGAQEFDPSNPMESASYAITSAAKGAAFGGAVGGVGPLAGMALKKPAQWTQRTTGRWIKDFLNNQIWGQKGASQEKVKLLTDHFNPVLREIGKSIGPEGVGKIETGWLKTADQISLVPESELGVLWNKFAGNPKARIDVLSRYLARKYPNSRNMDQLYEDIVNHRKNVWSKMDELEQYAKSAFDEFDINVPLEDVVDDLDKFYSRNIKDPKSYKAVFDKSDPEYNEIIKALYRLYQVEIRKQPDKIIVNLPKEYNADRIDAF